MCLNSTVDVVVEFSDVVLKGSNTFLYHVKEDTIGFTGVRNNLF